MTTSLPKRQGQIQRGIVPTGYQLTPLGIRPANWTMCRIGDCLKRVERPVKVQPDAMYTQIGIRSHGKGLFYKEPVTGSELGNKAVFWIEPDCFILNIVFAWEQAIGKTTKAETGMVGSHRFPMYRPVKGRVDIDYLIDFFLTKRGADILEAASPGGAGRNKTLGQARFLKDKIVLPPLAEQQKIATILATQDRIIELWNRKINQLKLLKKYCLEKMLPRLGRNIPEIRFSDFSESWTSRPLGEIAQFSKGAGYSKADLRESGTPIILYGRLYTKYELEIADVDTFAMAQPDAVYSRGGEVIIPASGETAEDIAIASVVGNPGILIGGDINILFPSSEIDATFMAMSLSGGPAHNEVAKRAQGKSVVHLHNADLEKVMLSYPSLKEQKRISAFFRLVEHLIALHQRRLAAEEQKKKALMQLLLTGIVRV